MHLPPISQLCRTKKRVNCSERVHARGGVCTAESRPASRTFQREGLDSTASRAGGLTVLNQGARRARQTKRRTLSASRSHDVKKKKTSIVARCARYSHQRYAPAAHSSACLLASFSLRHSTLEQQQQQQRKAAHGRGEPPEGWLGITPVLLTRSTTPPLPERD